MHEVNKEPPDTSRGFEQSDLSFQGITSGVFWYFVFTVFVGVVVFAYMYLSGNSNPGQQALITERRLPAQPTPLLQNNVTARTDIWNLRGHEDYLLTNRTWINLSFGVARIPVSEAMDIAVEHGPQALNALPDRPRPTIISAAMGQFYQAPPAAGPRLTQQQVTDYIAKHPLPPPRRRRGPPPSPPPSTATPAQGGGTPRGGASQRRPGRTPGGTRGGSRAVPIRPPAPAGAVAPPGGRL